MSYVDVFGGDTVPPSEYAFKAVTLTENTVYYWPDNYSGPNTIAAIMNITSTTANLVVTLPHGNEVSTGRDILIRNIGSETFIVKDSAENTVTSLLSGESKYIYLIDNSTEAGTWSVIAYGVGSSTVDAGALVGYGIKALNTTLNQAHPTTNISTNYTVQLSDRAKLLIHTGGASIIYLPTLSVMGDDFFFMLRNSGTGTLTIDPFGSETIDGVSTFYINPGESLFVCSSGSAWFSVGYGRATEFNFTQLTKDVSAAGTFTLTTAEAANKLLTFIGTPAIGYTVIVPPTIQVYYVHNNVSTVGDASVTIKTATGSGPEVEKDQRLIVFCDGVNVYSATSSSSFTTIIDVGDSGYATARYAYTEPTGSNDTVIVPYSGFISVEVYLNGALVTEEFNDYEYVESGDNTIFTFASDLDLNDKVYFILSFLADFSTQSFVESHVFTATENQTTFSWITTTFINAGILAFVNGSKQVNNYTQTGNSIVFDTGLNAGDIVEVCIIQNVQDAISATQPILMMPQEINTNTIIPTGYNALSVDPTINAVVTISSGSVWAIVGD